MQSKYVHINGAGPNSEDLNLIAATGASASDVALDALVALRAPVDNRGNRDKAILWRYAHRATTSGYMPTPASGGTVKCPPFMAAVGPTGTMTALTDTSRFAVFAGSASVSTVGAAAKYLLYATVQINDSVSLGTRKIKSTTTGAVSNATLSAKIDSVVCATAVYTSTWASVLPADVPSSGTYYIPIAYSDGSVNYDLTSVALSQRSGLLTIETKSLTALAYQTNDMNDTSGPTVWKSVAAGSVANVRAGDIVEVAVSGEMFRQTLGVNVDETFVKLRVANSLPVTAAALYERTFDFVTWASPAYSQTLKSAEFGYSYICSSGDEAAGSINWLLTYRKATAAGEVFEFPSGTATSVGHGVTVKHWRP